MTSKEFELELKALDERLTVTENPNRPGLSNVKLDGNDVCPIPTHDLRDKPDRNYVYLFPNGMEARHNSREDALAKVNAILKMIQTPEGRDAFFGLGEYA